MKNTFVITVMLAAVCAVYAQFPTDTIPGRYDKYYYTSWYDQCPGYYNGGWIDSCKKLSITRISDSYHVVGYNYTPQPLKVKGLVALIDQFCGGRGYRDTTRVEEYLYLYQYDTSEFMIMPGYERPAIFVDSVRFDTAMPKRMMLPRHSADPAPLSCYVYEGYFKSPVTVDSSFYIYPSRHNNRVDGNGIYLHKPLFYVSFQMVEFDTCTQRSSWCYFGSFHTMYREDYEGDSILGFPPRHGFINAGWPEDWPGFYLPIIDQYNIEVRSADSTTGSVSGGGLIPDGWVDTLRAFPSAGYEFTHWDDGSTDNPRIITVMGDSLFTAVFEPTDRTYTVTLDVNNLSWGSVEGAGSYPVYQQVEIRAVAANDTFAFVGWSDANWRNPRTITLTRDTSFTANFQRVLAVEESGTQAALFAEIRPNPASGSVCIDVKAEGRCRAEFIDAAGRVRYARSFDAPTADIDISLLQPGAWIVRITTPAGTTHRRLVVK